MLCVCQAWALDSHDNLGIGLSGQGVFGCIYIYISLSLSLSVSRSLSLSLSIEIYGHVYVCTCLFGL